VTRILPKRCNRLFPEYGFFGEKQLLPSASFASPGVSAHPFLFQAQIDKIMKADSRLDEETAFCQDAIKVTEMPYFQADTPVVAHTRVKSEKIGPVIPVYYAGI